MDWIRLHTNWKHFCGCGCGCGYSGSECAGCGCTGGLLAVISFSRPGGTESEKVSGHRSYGTPCHGIPIPNPQSLRAIADWLYASCLPRRLLSCSHRFVPVRVPGSERPPRCLSRHPRLPVTLGAKLNLIVDFPGYPITQLFLWIMYDITLLHFTNFTARN